MVYSPSLDIVGLTHNFTMRERLRLPSVPHLYPSEASVAFTNEDGEKVILGNCLRATYWRYTGVKQAPSTEYLQMTGQLGKSCELMLVEMWKQMGILVDAHVRFQSKEYNISGELDAIIMNPQTGVLVGAEIKSFYGYYAQKEILGNKSQAGQPKPKHLLQTVMYAREFQGILDHFSIVYVERGDGTLRSYEVNALPDEENGEIVYRPQVDGEVIMDYTVDDIYKRYGQVLKAVETKTLPEREFVYKYSNEQVEMEYEKDNLSKSKYEAFKKVKKDGTVTYNEKERPGSWQCAYCPFRPICYKNTGECIE